MRGALSVGHNSLTIMKVSLQICLLLLLFVIASLAHDEYFETRGPNLWHVLNNQGTNVITVNGTAYSSMFGVEVIEVYITSLDVDGWLRYELTIPTAGLYSIDLCVSSPQGEGSFYVGSTKIETIYAQIYNIPATAETTSWEAIRRIIDLPIGDVTLEIRSLRGGWNLKNFSLTYLGPTRTGSDNSSVETEGNGILSSMMPSSMNSSTGATFQSPVPAFHKMIAADNFVSMQGVELQVSSEGLDNIGWLDPSDYVTYNLSLPYSGMYELKARISSPEGDGAFQIINSETQELYAQILNLPKTGDFQIWQTISNPISLPGGSLSLRFVSQQQGWNMIWFSLELLEIDQSSPPSRMPSMAPTKLAPLQTPPSPLTEIPTKKPTPISTISPTTVLLTQPTRTPIGTPTWSPRISPTPIPTFQSFVTWDTPIKETTRTWNDHP